MGGFSLRSLTIVSAGMLAGCPPANQAPLSPVLTISQVTGTSIAGTVAPCNDDGLPSSPGVCTLTLVVAPQGSTGPPQGSGSVVLPESGGAFSVTGLDLNSNGYSVVATANDGALSTYTSQDEGPNQAPNTPVLSNVTAPNNALVRGEINSCTDDGFPGSCLQSVIATPSSESCTAVGTGFTCSYPFFATAPDPMGQWEFTSPPDPIAPGAEYKFYGVHEDGAIAVLSSPVIYRVPETVAGCDKHAAVQRTVLEDVPPNPTIPAPAPGFQNGAITGWEVQSMDAVDAIFGGFAQQALWAGIDRYSAAVRWIETGVTRGATPPGGVPAPIHAYFTAYGDALYNPTVLLPGVPGIGQTQFFKTIDCNNGLGTLADLGCTSLGAKWVTCVDAKPNGIDVSNCFTWSDAVVEALVTSPDDPNPDVAPLGFGNADFHVGMESTCAPSEIDTTKVEQVRYRKTNLTWVSVDDLNGQRVFLGGYPCTANDPCTSSVHSLNCCNGQAGQYNEMCIPPRDFFYYQNAASTTVLPGACQ